MGWFGNLFGISGLSNSTTNMVNPLGFQRCLQLCNIYDNWGGYKTPTRLLIGTPTGPGIELYEICKLPNGLHLFRGVIFAQVYKNNKLDIELRAIEFQDFGDGGCPCFGVTATMEHVKGDLYRTSKSFTSYKDGKKMDTWAEVNWNKFTNELVYREEYIPAEDCYKE